MGEGGKFTFSRAQRLDGPHAYAAVFAYKCWVSGRWFQVFVQPSGAAKARLGVVVSKRIMKLAVARNSYKRLARDIFRHSCHTVSGLDFVIRPKARYGSAEANEARAELRDLLRRSVGQCRNRRPEITEP